MLNLPLENLSNLGSPGNIIPKKNSVQNIVATLEKPGYCPIIFSNVLYMDAKPKNQTLIFRRTRCECLCKSHIVKYFLNKKIILAPLYS